MIIWIFIVSFVLIIFSTIIIVNTRAITWVKQKSSIIALIFALTQFVLFIQYAINAMIHQIWEVTLLKDLCPFIAFASVPIFISDKRPYFKMIMPWLMIGSVTTIFSGGTDFSSSFWAGIYNYGAHTLMLVQGVFVYLVVDKYSRQDLWKILVFPAIMIVWIMLVGYMPWQLTDNPRWAVYSTGLLKPGAMVWDQGDYHFEGAFTILGSFGIPYPVPTFIFYAMAVLVAYLIVLNKKYFPIYKAYICKWWKDKVLLKTRKQKPK